MIQEYEIKDYIKGQFSQGQSISGMVNHIIYDRVDIDDFIITKAEGKSKTSISRDDKIKDITKYVKEIHG